jgi:(2Fe-2S) ferredoxin
MQMEPDNRSSDAKKIVYVCLNDDCCKRGNKQMYTDLLEECASLSNVEIREYICFGNCDCGANTIIYPDKVWFSGLRAGDSAIVMNYLANGICSARHTGKVDDELADTMWELLELDVDSGELSVE